jgi:hypothetical protein
MSTGLCDYGTQTSQVHSNHLDLTFERKPAVLATVKWMMSIGQSNSIYKPVDR